MGVPIDSIGRKIRTLRKNLGYTLDRVARETGLSKGLLSQVERGISSPSLETLWKIGRTLGTSMAELLAEAEEPQVRLVRRDERRRLDVPESQGRLFLLGHGAKRSLGVVEVHIPPGGAVTGTFAAAEGEECIVVVEGSVGVQVNQAEWLLARGDSLLIHGGSYCRLVNPNSAETAVCLWTAQPFKL